jgi:hypothetical protein
MNNLGKKIILAVLATITASFATTAGKLPLNLKQYGTGAVLREFHHDESLADLSGLDSAIGQRCAFHLKTNKMLEFPSSEGLTAVNRFDAIIPVPASKANSGSRKIVELTPFYILVEDSFSKRSDGVYPTEDPYEIYVSLNIMVKGEPSVKSSLAESMSSIISFPFSGSSKPSHITLAESVKIEPLFYKMIVDQFLASHSSGILSDSFKYLSVPILADDTGGNLKFNCDNTLTAYKSIIGAYAKKYVARGLIPDSRHFLEYKGKILGDEEEALHTAGVHKIISLTEFLHEHFLFAKDFNRDDAIEAVFNYVFTDDDLARSDFQDNVRRLTVDLLTIFEALNEDIKNSVKASLMTIGMTPPDFDNVNFIRMLDDKFNLNDASIRRFLFEVTESSDMCRLELEAYGCIFTPLPDVEPLLVKKEVLGNYKRHFISALKEKVELMDPIDLSQFDSSFVLGMHHIFKERRVDEQKVWISYFLRMGTSFSSYIFELGNYLAPYAGRDFQMPHIGMLNVTLKRSELPFYPAEFDEFDASVPTWSPFSYEGVSFEGVIFERNKFSLMFRSFEKRGIIPRIKRLKELNLYSMWDVTIERVEDLKDVADEAEGELIYTLGLPIMACA